MLLEPCQYNSDDDYWRKSLNNLQNVPSTNC